MSGADAETLAWLRLARAEGVGAVTFRRLIEDHRGAAAALEALPELARRAGRAAPPRIPTAAEAERELAAGARLGATLLLAGRAAWPAPLQAIDDAPPLLWALGEPALLGRRALAMVGARTASAAGRRFARDLARELGEAGLVVVSGLARGVDAAAHEGALASGSVAVLAGGVDRPYPPENRDLYERLCTRGCVVSERALGHEARAPDFPRRNRIISGLALGVVVVEAELRSGSLITARLAGEQGREVFAVPGSPMDPRARGTNDLIRQGAVLVESAADVLAVLEVAPGRAAPRARPAAPAVADDDLGDLAEAIWALLSSAPASLDELSRASGASPAAVNAVLVELSLAGRASLLPGGLAVRA